MSEADGFLRRVAPVVPSLGERHPLLLGLRGQLSLLRQAQSRREEAELLQRSVWQDQFAISGMESPDTAAAAARLGAMLLQMGRASEAVIALGQAKKYLAEDSTTALAVLRPQTPPHRPDRQSCTAVPS